MKFCFKKNLLQPSSVLSLLSTKQSTSSCLFSLGKITCERDTSFCPYARRTRFWSDLKFCSQVCKHVQLILLGCWELSARFNTVRSDMTNHTLFRRFLNTPNEPFKHGNGENVIFNQNNFCNTQPLGNTDTHTQRGTTCESVPCRLIVWCLFGGCFFVLCFFHNHSYRLATFSKTILPDVKWLGINIIAQSFL